MTASFEVTTRVAYVGFHSTSTNKTSWLHFESGPSLFISSRPLNATKNCQIKRDTLRNVICSNNNKNSKNNNKKNQNLDYRWKIQVTYTYLWSWHCLLSQQVYRLVNQAVHILTRTKSEGATHWRCWCITSNSEFYLNLIMCLATFGAPLKDMFGNLWHIYYVW